jgi:hypothetical protein
MQLSFDENMTINHIREAILPPPILAYLHIKLKGTVSRDGYFSERTKKKYFIQYFLCLCWWFLRYYKSFSLPYIILFASLKLLTNFENAY